MNSTSSPTKTASEDPAIRQAVLGVCRRYGIDEAGLRQIHRYSNVIYQLPRAGIVARVTGPSLPAHRAAASQNVVNWLISACRFPATEPITTYPPAGLGRGLTVAFWRHYPQTAVTHPTSVHLARVLRELHALPAPPMRLEDWVPLRSLEHALHEPASQDSLSAEEHAWLLDLVAKVRDDLAGLDWPLGVGLIHADAWAGNLLWNPAQGPEQVVLADWDNVGFGPREVDLIPTWHATVRYGRGTEWVTRFADTYGYELSRWGGFGALMRMRDLIQLTGPLRRAPAEPVLKQALRQRLTAIRDHDLHAQWQAY
jgi:thiamine kinase-like enzyme